MKTILTAAVAVLALAGCSSSSAPEPATSSPPAPSSEASLVGPIMVEPAQTEVSATVGRFLSFDVGDDPGKWQITTSDESVVTVQAGGERDGAVFNPGGEAVGVGEATVTLTAGEDAQKIRITVTD